MLSQIGTLKEIFWTSYLISKIKKFIKQIMGKLLIFSVLVEYVPISFCYVFYAGTHFSNTRPVECRRPLSLIAYTAAVSDTQHTCCSCLVVSTIYVSHHTEGERYTKTVTERARKRDRGKEREGKA